MACVNCRSSPLLRTFMRLEDKDIPCIRFKQNKKRNLRIVESIRNNSSTVLYCILLSYMWEVVVCQVYDCLLGHSCCAFQPKSWIVSKYSTDLLSILEEWSNFRWGHFWRKWHRKHATQTHILCIERFGGRSLTFLEAILGLMNNSWRQNHLVGWCSEGHIRRHHVPRGVFLSMVTIPF